MSKFDTMTGIEREDMLMETAMCIMETYRDMLNRKEISSEAWESKFCTGELDSIALLRLFRDWAREFENIYYDTDEYADDYLGLVETFATAKLKELFTKDPVVVAKVEVHGERIEILK